MFATIAVAFVSGDQYNLPNQPESGNCYQQQQPEPTTTATTATESNGGPDCIPENEGTASSGESGCPPGDDLPTTTTTTKTSYWNPNKWK